jgi:divalent metal cation (Fe/Co/Zn/Cd) transporter
MTLAAVFAIVLIILVFGKLRGSDMIRVFAWFLFFYFLGIFAVILSYTWILSFLVGEPVTLSPVYSLQFLFGVVLAGAGISYRPVMWTKRTMQRRLRMKAAEIERAYHQIWRETAASMRFPDVFLVLAGLGAMFYSARMGVSGIPTYLLKPLDALAGICIALCIVAIAWDLATRRKNGHR